MQEHMEKFDGTIRDTCDTEAWRNHPFILKHKAFQGYTVHMDDLELCNPLGLFAGKPVEHSCMYS